MPKKQLTTQRLIAELSYIVGLVKSKRGAIVTAVGMIAAWEAANPGFIASHLGNQGAAIVLGIVGFLTFATKYIDGKK